jgi:exopolyphosphatase/pppGpp-phosphohydrolase
VSRELRYVRLGQGVDATRRFHPEALARTFSAAEEFSGIVQASGVDKIRCLATSAARDVENRQEFLKGMQARLGVKPEVISGDEEARLSFLGALAGGPVPPGVIVVSDIGGGSTEIIVGDHTGWVEVEQSLNIGSVRLRERFLQHDPPTPDQVRAARAFVADELDHCVPLLRARTQWQRRQPALPPFETALGAAPPITAAHRHTLAQPETAVDRGTGRQPETSATASWAGTAQSSDPVTASEPAPPVTWIGVAGTSTSISAMQAHLTTYDPEVVHNSTVEVADIIALSDHLLGLSTAEVRRQYPILQPLRAEVIAGGVLIAAELARRVACSMLVRETDILDGAALDLLDPSP